ncbi:MAG: dihydropteroate synthase [Pseudomonadota bacterium]
MDPNFNDGRLRLMGILNVTPDSFSDGGKHFHEADAFEAAQRMKGEGADILDIGAESTRPGFTPVSVDEEISRLKPLISKIADLKLPVSIDTTKARVAAFAIEQGAGIINDIWGLQKDNEMARLAAVKDVPVILMHNRAEADDKIDIMAEMQQFFMRSLEISDAAGVKRGRLVIDPGIGFGKTLEQNLVVLKNIALLKRFNIPILVGASRKSFIGKIVESAPQQRLAGTIAAHLAAVKNGASILRVHDVADMKQALLVDEAIQNA